MKTLITKQIADRLEELAVQWKDHTSQAEALMMAAKEVMTFQEKEKEQIVNAVKYGYKKDYYIPNFREQQELFEDYYEQTYGGNK